MGATPAPPAPLAVTGSGHGLETSNNGTQEIEAAGRLPGNGRGNYYNGGQAILIFNNTAPAIPLMMRGEERERERKKKTERKQVRGREWGSRQREKEGDNEESRGMKNQEEGRGNSQECITKQQLLSISCLEKLAHNHLADWNRETRCNAQSLLLAMSQFSFIVAT